MADNSALIKAIKQRQEQSSASEDSTPSIMAPEPTEAQQVETAGRSALEGMSFGVSEPAVSGINAVASNLIDAGFDSNSVNEFIKKATDSERLHEEYKKDIERRKELKSQMPGTAMTAEMFGALLSPGNKALEKIGEQVGKQAFRLTSKVPAKLGEVALRGATYGVVPEAVRETAQIPTGFMTEEEAPSIGHVATTGAAVTGAIEGVVGAVPIIGKNILRLGKAIQASEMGQTFKKLVGNNIGQLGEGSIPNLKAQAIAENYMESRGQVLAPTPKVKVNEERARKIAQAYEEMPHTPYDPKVKRAYNALINETMEQFQHIKESGLKLSPIKPGQSNPYKNSEELMKDIRDNNHMWFLPTEGNFGPEEAVSSSNHPLLKSTTETVDGKPLLANDVFRIVHDYFGHVKPGVGFGPNGEENAWLSHMRMYSPEAQKALTTETRGQNSWVNFGPHGEHNRANPAQTIYGEQKAGLLPEWAMESEAHPPKQLVHYSRAEGMPTKLDPAYMGQGAAGRESERLGRVPRTYYYESEAVPEGVVMQGAKSVHTIERPEKIIDLNSEEAQKFINVAEKISSSEAEATNNLELILKQQGYDGFKNSASPVPDAVALFHAQTPIKSEVLGPQHFTSARARQAAIARSAQEPKTAVAVAQKPKLKEIEGGASEEPTVESRFQKIKDALAKIIKDNDLSEVIKGEEGEGYFINDMAEALLGKNKELTFSSPEVKKSPYALPEVIRALIRGQAEHPKNPLLILENDGPAYEALMKKFPELLDNQNWSEVVYRDLAKRMSGAPAEAPMEKISPTSFVEKKLGSKPPKLTGYEDTELEKAAQKIRNNFVKNNNIKFNVDISEGVTGEKGLVGKNNEYFVKVDNPKELFDLFKKYNIKIPKGHTFAKQELIYSNAVHEAFPDKASHISKVSLIGDNAIVSRNLNINDDLYDMMDKVNYLRENPIPNQEKTLNELAAINFILGNRDRHSNNWKINNKGNIVLFDHGLSGENLGITEIVGNKMPMYLKVLQKDHVLDAKSLKSYLSDDKQMKLIETLKKSGASKKAIADLNHRWDNLTTMLDNIIDFNSEQKSRLFWEHAFEEHSMGEKEFKVNADPHAQTIKLEAK